MARHLAAALSCAVLAMVLPSCTEPAPPPARPAASPSSQLGLSEDTLAARPELRAGAHTVVALHVDVPGAARAGDLGEASSDRVPYFFEQELTLRICAEEIPGVDYSLAILDETEREVLRLEGGADCVSRTLGAGAYTKEIRYRAVGGAGGGAIFLRPSYDGLAAAASLPGISSALVPGPDPACKVVNDFFLKTPTGYLAYTHRYVEDYTKFLIQPDYPAMDGFSKWRLFECGDGTFQLQSVATGRYLFELIGGDLFASTAQLFLQSDQFVPDPEEQYSYRIHGSYDAASNRLGLWFPSTYGTHAEPFGHFPFYYCDAHDTITADMADPAAQRTGCGAQTRLMSLGLVGPTRGITVSASCDGCDLSGIDLLGFDVGKYSFRGARFDGANVVGTSFAGADLTGASFDHATLVFSDFSSAKLDAARVTYAQARYVSFAGASLHGASFASSDLRSSPTATGQPLAGPAMLLQGCRLRSYDNDTQQVIETGYLRFAHPERFPFSTCPADVCAFAGPAMMPGAFDADCQATVAPAGTPNWLEISTDLSQASLDCTDFGHADLSFNPTLKDAVKAQRLDCRNSFAFATIPPSFEPPASWRFLDLGFARIQSLSTDYFGDRLARIDFSSAKLAGINLSGFDLSDSRFDGADLHQAKLVEADASSATFRGAQLADAVFFGARLQGADFSSLSAGGSLCTSERYVPGAAGVTDLHSASFKSASAAKASFSRAFLSDADFSYALLADAELGSTFMEACGSDASQTAAVFDHATLEGARFDLAQLRAVSFRGATLNGVDFDHQALLYNDFTDAQLSGASFVGAQIASADFTSAVLLNASFAGATLSAADRMVVLEGAQLGGASFDDAKLLAVNLSNALAPVGDVCGAGQVMRPWSYWKYVDGMYQKIQVTYGRTTIERTVYGKVTCPVDTSSAPCDWMTKALGDLCVPDPTTNPDDSTVIQFQDAAFEACLRATAFGSVALPYTGKITANLAATVRHVSCANRKIAAVRATELAAFVHLQTLDLGSNQLQALDLGPLAAVQSAEAGKQGQSDFVGLVKLAVSYNRLDSLALSGLPWLQSVEAAGCGLKTLTLGAELALSSLDVSSNGLTGLNLLFAPNVEYVDVSNNHLRSLTTSSSGLASFSRLMYLSAANDDLTSLGDLHCLDPASTTTGCATGSGRLTGIDLRGNRSFDCSSLEISSGLLIASGCGE